jgi:hypothetical protein
VSWVVVSNVALDEKNGAGMRAAIPYLRLMPETSFSSLFLYLGHSTGNAITGVNYIAVPYVDAPGIFNLFRVFYRTFRAASSRFKKTDHFLIIPNTIQDVLMGLACRLVSPKIVVWVMDDFISAYAVEGRIVKRIYFRLFHLLYRLANRRVAIADPMRDHYRKKIGIEAEFILGKTLPHALPPKQKENHEFPNKRKWRLVYIGSFISHYLEPIKRIKDLLKDPNTHLEIDLEIDLYGINPPPAEWLLPGKITYCGSLQPEKVLEVLQEYDLGLLTYSFNIETERMMSLSFPSKLIDYLGAALPVMAFVPPKLTFLSILEAKDVGITEVTLDLFSMKKALNELRFLDHPTYLRWQINSHKWAQEDFIMDQNKIRKILS